MFISVIVIANLYINAAVAMALHVKRRLTSASH